MKIRLDKKVPPVDIRGVWLRNRHFNNKGNTQYRFYGKAFSFSSTRQGFEAFCHWMKSLMTEHEKTEVIVGMEPTGHYWMILATFLQSRKIPVVVVNLMHVKKSKELDDNSPTKNDPKDECVIAQLGKDERYSAPYFPTGVYAELRETVKIPGYLSKSFNAFKRRCITGCIAIFQNS